uniref:Uncharacterized protein n=1 Tax=Arundo donax TaxID=35708 RepID=A0A0A9A9N1_ARUDO
MLDVRSGQSLEKVAVAELLTRLDSWPGYVLLLD